MVNGKAWGSVSVASNVASNVAWRVHWHIDDAVGCVKQGERRVLLLPRPWLSSLALSLIVVLRNERLIC